MVTLFAYNNYGELSSPPEDGKVHFHKAGLGRQRAAPRVNHQICRPEDESVVRAELPGSFTPMSLAGVPE